MHESLQDDVSFSSPEGMNMYRIIQESVNNAIKYAQASNISVNISTKDSDILVSIEDDGIGFDPRKVIMGNGLKNIEKWAAEIQGTLEVRSQDNEGTTVLLKKPMNT